MQSWGVREDNRYRPALGMTNTAPIPVGSGSLATLNPSDKAASITLSNANYKATVSGSVASVRATVSKSTGKWYFEVKDDLDNIFFGIATSAMPLSNYPGQDTSSYGCYSANGTLYYNDVPQVTIGSFTSGDKLMFAIDFAALKLWVGKNGVWNGDPAAGTGGVSINPGTYFPALGLSGLPAAATINFGAIAFSYSPPTGFPAWG